MDRIHRTTKILLDAEKAISALAGEAAQASEYDEAAMLITIARETHDLGARVEVGAPTDRVRVDVAPIAGKADATSVNGIAQRRGSSRHKARYPIFLREGETLVKIAWSPSAKEEYEHKGPRRALGLLAAAITKTGANGKRFTMERILPVVDPIDGQKLPTYQAYLALAWFRALGFITQHGRQGYTLATRAPIEPLIETHWANLPSR